MSRLRFIPIDGTAEAQLARAITQQPSYLDGLRPQPGFAALSRSMRLRPGEVSFRRAGEIILSWDMHRRAGLRVYPETPRANGGSTVVLGLGIAGAALVIPCRVREAFDEPTRIGFNYLTLPGHPECGIEQFQVELAEDDTVRATVTSVSRPGTMLVKLGAPVNRLTQRYLVDRYLKAVHA
ncbi:MAG: DUF1990 family protein [Jatrophihabitantaceae bacterium]